MNSVNLRPQPRSPVAALKDSETLRWFFPAQAFYFS
jgi:hypothetical protein